MALKEADFRATTADELSSSPAHEAGDDFESIYRAYVPQVERFIRRYVSNPSLKEELVQETFLRAFRVWRSVDTSKPLGPWLRTIALHVCMNNWRDSGSKVSYSLDAESSSVASLDNDPFDVLIANTVKEGVNEALGELSPRERRILVLKDLQGLRYKEIARLEGITLAALRCALAVARKRFRERYLAVAEERGFGSVLPPVVGLALRRLKASTRRALRALGSATQRVNTFVGTDVSVSVTPTQVSSGIVALAIALATLPAIPHDRQSTARPRSLDARTTAEDSGIRATRFVGPLSATAVGHAEDPIAAAQPTDQGVADTQQEPATPGPSGPTAEPQVIDPSRVPAPPGSDVVPSPHPVDPPVDPDNVNNPNRNVESPKDAQISSFASSPTSDSTILAAGRNRECATQYACPAVLFRSDDGGATWTRLRADGFDGNKLLLPPAYGAGDERIFAMSSTGVLQVSSDGGNTFSAAAAGAPQLSGTMDISPAFDSGDPKIVIGTQTSLMEYSDETKTITPAAYSSVPGSLEPAYASRKLLLVGGRMINQRRSWGSAVFRCEGPVCTGTRIGDYPVTPKLRLAQRFAENGRMYAFTPGAIYGSVDGGATFARLASPSTEGDIRDLGVTGDGGQLFSAVRTPQPNGHEGLYVSSDAGATWSKLEDHLFSAGANVVKVTASRVFVGLADGGIACSSDLGATWSDRC